MSNDVDKFKHSRRLQKEENAIKKQVKIAKQHGVPDYDPSGVDQPHRFAKHHAMDCGNPECFLCGNPRKTHKDKLTIQEKKFLQDMDNTNNRHGNGSNEDNK